MTKLQEHLRRLGPWIAVLVTLSGAAWGEARATFVSHVAFSADSARRDTKAALDSAERSTDHLILIEIKDRVSAIYCDKKPAGCQ